MYCGLNDARRRKIVLITEKLTKKQRSSKQHSMNSSLVKKQHILNRVNQSGNFQRRKKQAIKFLLSPRCKQAEQVGDLKSLIVFFF